MSLEEVKLENAKEKLEKSIVLPVNKKHILNFVNAASTGQLRDGEPISIGRQYKFLTVLTKLDHLLEKDFADANKSDIEKLVAKINTMKNKHGKPVQDWTKYTYKVVLKRFYKWLKGDNDEYPKEVKWIHPRMMKRNGKLPEELLTTEDIKKMANATDNLRDRAFILFLYESGARIGEIMSIQLKHFEPDEYGAKVLIPKGKTGPRKIRIIASAPAISNWLSNHPDRNNKLSLLFCGISNYKRGEDIVYQNYRKMLRKMAKRAGVDKPVNPHHFRHSRATELAKSLSSAILCEYLGWVQGSREAATYVHLSGEASDKEILKIHGLTKNDQKEHEFKSIECPRCGIKNDPAAKFCKGCSLGLDEKSVMEFDAQKDQATQMGFADMAMLKDPKFSEFYNEMLLNTIEKYKELKNSS